MTVRDPDLKITAIQAFPTSFPVKPADSISLGIGRVVKRDAVIVKVTTAGGIIGYGESHHGRAPGTVAHLVNTTLRQLVLGMNAADVVGVWKRIYDKQLASHGMGAGACLAMSGIDQALWTSVARQSVGPSTNCSAAAQGRFPPMRAACRSATRNPPRSCLKRGHISKPATKH